MKLLFVVSSLSSGGAERVMSLLANGLSAKHDVSVATFSNEPSFYALDRKVRHIKLGLMKDSENFGQRVSNTLMRVMELKKLFTKGNPDIVVSFMTHTNILAIAAAKLSGRKIVVSERIVYDFYGSKFLNFARHLVYPFADALVTQTRADLKHYGFVKNALAIPNPLDVSVCVHQAEKEKIVLGVGRLDPQKGFDTLIRAFCRLGRSDWKLVIAGEGSERAKLEALIEKLGAKNIMLPGRTSEIFKWYKKASIFVLSSKREGFPNVLLEAMACGTPVVASNVGGIPFMVENGKNGFLFDSENVEELADKIVALSKDEKLRRKMGEAGKEKVKEFTWDKIAEQTVKVYREILGRG